MTGESRNTPPDVRFKPAGVGLAGTFRCAACGVPKMVLGRKLRRVQGVRQWVCARCAA